MTPAERIIKRANELFIAGKRGDEPTIQAITEWLEELKKGMPLRPLNPYTQSVLDKWCERDGAQSEYDRLKAWLDEKVWGDEKIDHWARFEKFLTDRYTPDSQVWGDWTAIKDDLAKRPESHPKAGCQIMEDLVDPEKLKRPESKPVGVKEVMEAHKKFQDYPSEPSADLIEELAKVLCFAFYSDNSKWDRVSEATRDAYRAEAHAATAFLKGKL